MRWHDGLSPWFLFDPPYVVHRAYETSRYLVFKQRGTSKARPTHSGYITRVRVCYIGDAAPLLAERDESYSFEREEPNE